MQITKGPAARGRSGPGTRRRWGAIAIGVVVAALAAGAPATTTAATPTVVAKTATDRRRKVADRFPIGPSQSHPRNSVRA